MHLSAAELAAIIMKGELESEHLLSSDSTSGRPHGLNLGYILGYVHGGSSDSFLLSIKICRLPLLPYTAVIETPAVFAELISAQSSWLNNETSTVCTAS